MNKVTVRRMNEDVKEDPGRKRRYHSPRRLEQAAATRHAVLTAARELFIDNGYTATTVTEIAQRAGVSLDTPSGATMSRACGPPAAHGT